MPASLHRDVNSLRGGTVKDTFAPGQHTGIKAAGPDTCCAGQQHKTDFIRRAIHIKRLPGLKVMKPKTDIGPSCGCRGDIMNDATLPVRPDKQF